MKNSKLYIKALLLIVFGLAINNTVMGQCITPVITEISNSGPACAGGTVTLHAAGTIAGISSSSIRMAGIGGNYGDEAFNQVFSTGDRAGSIARLSSGDFDAILAGASSSSDADHAAALKASYDVLMFTWASDYDANITWGLITAFLNLGGSVFVDGDYNNIGNLSPNVVGYGNDGSSGCSYILVSPPPFPTLVANGVNGCFVNNHISMSSWPSWMSAYIMASDNTTTMAIAGIYPSGNHGRLIVQGPDMDYHADKYGDGTQQNQYQVCLNQIDFLSANQAGITWSGPNGFSSNDADPTITGVTYADAGVYTATLTNVTGGGCSTSSTTTLVVVDAGTISGASSVCPGHTITLSTTGSGGTWSSGNTSIATVSSSGVVSGVSTGTVTISYTATSDACGTVYSTKTITVLNSVSVTVSAAAAPAISNGTQSANTCYWGYQHENFTATATGGSGFTYSWSPNGGSTSMVTDYPSSTSSLQETVTVTNSDGCTATAASASITVYDIRCGSGMSKANVCHYSSSTHAWQTLCIDQTSIQDHMGHSHTQSGATVWDYCGACGNAHKPANNVDPTAEVKVYPNPSDGMINVEIPSVQETAVITITDITGRVIDSKAVVNNNGAPVQLNLSQIASGLYLVKVSADDYSTVVKIAVK